MSIENRAFKESHPVGGFAWVFLHYVNEKVATWVSLGVTSILSVEIRLH